MMSLASAERDLYARAVRVIPGGMYGHQDVSTLWPEAPKYFVKGDGAYIWDVSGKRYIDLLCSYGPIILGHRHPKVDEAAMKQLSEGDCQNMPSPLFVNLAERFVEIVDHADWAMFMKNGSDATTLSLTIARACTGKKKILVASGAYHGAAPWCTPNMHGVVESDRANLCYYTYNDVASVDAALAEAGNDLAAIIVSPFRHDAGFHQEKVDPAFARHLRSVCDRAGALLILDDVRCGMRLAFGSSWEPIGVEPDLSAWSKAIANGYPLAALLGSDKVRDAARSVWAAGSFWFSAVPMAASLANLDVLEKENGVAHIQEVANIIVSGMEDQIKSLGLNVKITGEPALTYLKFEDEDDWEWTKRFAKECASRGLYVHPKHNWFISTAITQEIVKDILDITEQVFDSLKKTGAPSV